MLFCSTTMSQQIESHLPHPQAISLPVTPNKSWEVARRKHDTTPSPSLRERRGRKQYPSNGTFRPLSVFTKSLLVPFDLDTDRALDILKNDSPDRIEEAKSVLTPEKETKQTGTEQDTEDLSPGCQSTTSHTATLVGSMRDETTNVESEMDLMTALQITSPEKDSTYQLAADFSTLCQLPLPEQSQHPAFCSSPFEASTNLPLLFTSTSVEEIKLSNYQTEKPHGSSTKAGKESIGRKRSFFGLELKTPGSNRSRNAFSVSEDSPIPMMIATPKSIPTPRTSNTYSSVRGSSPLMELVVPKENAGSIGTASSLTVRKFSDLFRRKDSIERSLESPTWSPRNSHDSPNLERMDLVSAHTTAIQI